VCALALAAAATATSRIKLGTGICLVVQRDPIHTAKQVASLDRVSGGRLSVFGVSGEEKVVKRYRDAGLDRVVFGLPPADRETILPLLDRLAAWIE
jgi:alkanesulfonate monooxygenase SsuD/methylene tetrahydromethanopterin reductase-like flavin-dependent oxidoreductase (luciferase family)